MINKMKKQTYTSTKSNVLTVKPNFSPRLPLALRHLQTYLLACMLIISSCKKEEERFPSHDLSPGASAEALVSGAIFKKLRLEILHMPGHAPTAASVENINQFLNSRIEKPDGIQIHVRQIPSLNKARYSISDLLELERSHRVEWNQKANMSLCILLVDGDFSETNRVLGVAYRNTSMALFQKTVQQFSGGLTQPPRTILESTIFLHELGHVLGLVNNGGPMQQNHHDEANGEHCSNGDCLMYFAVETTDFAANLLGGSVPTLDANCSNDLNALR
jgi:predicted Zn-dependent protease